MRNMCISYSAPVPFLNEPQWSWLFIFYKSKKYET